MCLFFCLLLFIIGCYKCGCLEFSTDTTGELEVFRHNGNPLGVDSTEVGIFKQADKVLLRCFLDCQDGSGLKSEVRLEVLSYAPDKAGEGKFSNQELGGFLILADLSQGYGTRSIAAGLLHAAV